MYAIVPTMCFWLHGTTSPLSSQIVLIVLPVTSAPLQIAEKILKLRKAQKSFKWYFDTQGTPSIVWSIESCCRCSRSQSLRWHSSYDRHCTSLRCTRHRSRRNPPGILLETRCWCSGCRFGSEACRIPAEYFQTRWLLQADVRCVRRTEVRLRRSCQRTAVAHHIERLSARKRRSGSGRRTSGSKTSSTALLPRRMCQNSRRCHRKLSPARCIHQNDSDACRSFKTFSKDQKVHQKLQLCTHAHPTSAFSSSSLQFEASSSDPSRQSFLPLQSFVGSMHAPYEHLNVYLGHFTFSQMSSISSVRLKQSALPSQTSSSDMHVPSLQPYSKIPHCNAEKATTSYGTEFLKTSSNSRQGHRFTRAESSEIWTTWDSQVESKNCLISEDEIFPPFLKKKIYKLYRKCSNSL